MYFETAIPLEQNDQAIFDTPNCALISESGYFVSDDQGKALFRYHLDGTFDRLVTQKGSGPYEMNNSLSCTRIFGNQLALYNFFT